MAVHGTVTTATPFNDEHRPHLHGRWVAMWEIAGVHIM